MRMLACLLLLAVVGCKSGNAAWKADHVQLDTQFGISVGGFEVKVGFPGKISGSAEGAGELKPSEPVPVTPSEPTP